MKTFIGLLMAGLLVSACGEKPNPDPNRSKERLRYETQLLSKCHAQNVKLVMDKDWEALRAVCDAEFKEKLGYTHTEARESLKLRNIPD